MPKTLTPAHPREATRRPNSVQRRFRYAPGYLPVFQSERGHCLDGGERFFGDRSGRRVLQLFPATGLGRVLKTRYRLSRRYCTRRIQIYSQCPPDSRDEFTNNVSIVIRTVVVIVYPKRNTVSIFRYVRSTVSGQDGRFCFRRGPSIIETPRGTYISFFDKKFT